MVSREARSAQGWVGWGPELPDLAGGIPSHHGGAEIDF